jgi:hypothetical protein
MLCALIGQNSTESRTEHELQLLLGELSHIVTALGEAVAAVCEEIKAVATIHLRNSSFGVRAASAYVLASIATVIPGTAALYLRDALTGATTQATQLLAHDENDYAETKESTDLSQEGGEYSEQQSSPRRSPKDAERMQRMYCFHGNIRFILSYFILC